MAPIVGVDSLKDPTCSIAEFFPKFKFGFISKVEVASVLVIVLIPVKLFLDGISKW